MSRLLSVQGWMAAAAGLGLSASAWAAPIAINNPSFETPNSGNPDGWGIGQTDLADVSSDFAHSGSQSLKFTASPNQNTDAFNPVIGLASGDASNAVTMSANFYTPSSAPLSGTLYVLSVEFKKSLPGGGDTGVSSAEHVFVPEQLTANAWTPLSFTTTTAGPWDELILHVRTVGTEGASGLLYVDDVSAAVPEPASLGLVAVGFAGLLRRRRRA